MTELPAGVNFEQLTDAEREYLDFVDEHLPAFRSEGTQRGRTYGVEESEDPTALSYVSFSSSLDENRAGIPAETRSIEFTIMGPSDTFIPVFTISWNPEQGFNLSCATGEEGLNDPDFVMRQLDKLKDLEADEKMHQISQTTQDKV